MSRFVRVAAVGVALGVVAGMGAVVAPGAVAAPSTCYVNGTAVTGTLIQGTAGNDTINCSGGVAAGTTVNGGAGNDTIEISGVMAGAVNGGAGSDGITVAGTVGSAMVTGTVNGGGLLGALLDGDDIISLANFNTAAPVLAGTVDGGGGDDSIYVTSGREGDAAPNSALVSGAVLRGGPGADTIEIVGGSLRGAGSHAAVEAGATVDGGGLLGTLLDGYTTININRQRAETHGNRGTILLGDADGKVMMSLGDNAGTIDGQGGNDFIWTDTQVAPGKTLGGTGNDVLVVKTGVGLVDGGPGNDRCVAGDSLTTSSCESS